MATNGDSPIQVMLWSVPRSLSTVFEKCISFVPNTQIINELFVCASMYGPERITSEEKVFNETLQNAEYRKSLENTQIDLPMAFESDDCTFSFVKDDLEADCPGKHLVFCKDMAYALNEKYDMIPRGFRHTFLIRNPYRSLSSYKKLMAPYMAAVGTDNFQMHKLSVAVMPKGYTFQEQYDLMTYLQDNGEPAPIIIDADDLLENPSSVMRQYFALLGIPFTEDLLVWPASKDVIKTWKGSRDVLLGNFHEMGGYYDTALNSTHFQPPKDMPRREDLSEDILISSDFCMPYYQKMYDLRIKL